MLTFQMKEGNLKTSLEKYFSAHSEHYINHDVVICNLDSFKEMIGLLTSLVGTDTQLIYISTSKFYQLPECIEKKSRFLCHAIGEDQEIFVEPTNTDLAKVFACDSLVQEFSKANNIKASVLRPGCIVGYKPEISDGFIAKAWMCHKLNTKFQILGHNGKQVRDQLHISDFISGILKLIVNVKNVNKGEVFNIGGGIENSISPIELMSLMKSKGAGIDYEILPEAPDNRLCYITNNSKIFELSGWRPWYKISLTLDCYGYMV